MTTIKPFRALRPRPDVAKQVASKPYDVLNSEEARKEASGDPYSFLHITKSEIDLPPATDVHSAMVYEKAKQNLSKFIRDGILVREESACFYIYKLMMNGRAQTGLTCVSSVDDYFNNVVRKHELTRPEKEKDRIDHMLATGAQTGNVFLAYRDVPELETLLKTWKAGHDPAYDFVADDGVQHTVWVIDDQKTIGSITELFCEKVPCTYIADGHHRAASAAKVSKQLPGNDDAHYFLTTIFPAGELTILDYNRVVRNLNDRAPGEFLKLLETDFTIEKSVGPVAPAQLHEFGLYIDRRWYRLNSKPGTFSTDPIGVLDVTILSKNILEKILGITDQRTDKRIDFVGGIRGPGELERRVDSGEMAVAFSLYPVGIQQLFSIADTGNVMPPKSTWFEPKLRDGLLTHILSEAF